jgi:transcription initiation factor IIE alpha subunit
LRVVARQIVGMMEQRQLDTLCEIVSLIEQATGVVEETHQMEFLLTSADLARKLRLDHERVKKMLKILKDLGLIQAIGLNPKRYRFDHFQYRQLTTQNPTHEVVEAFSERLNQL